MANRDTIVIGASAGGVQALSALVSELPEHLPAAVFIVLHIPTEGPSLLPVILARDSHLEVAHAINGEEIKHGKIYVAPPDNHLLIEGGYVKLVRGPKENLHRPSIDALFRSAARWAGPRVIGVVLTGARDDGRTGMKAIKQRGRYRLSYRMIPGSAFLNVSTKAIAFRKPCARWSSLANRTSTGAYHFRELIW